jgi:hypothetical protein
MKIVVHASASRARYHSPHVVPSRPLASLLLIAGLACDPGAPTPECPPGTRADPVRARDLLDVVRRSRSDSPTAAPDPPICFGGAARGTVRPDGVIVLADSLAPGPAAARLAHMRLHLADGLQRYPVADIPCTQQIESALTAEARGIVAEIEVWHALERPGSPPYSFALAALAESPELRVDFVREQMRVAPATDALDVLVDDYRLRCPEAGPAAP